MTTLAGWFCSFCFEPINQLWPSGELNYCSATCRSEGRRKVFKDGDAEYQRQAGIGRWNEKGGGHQDGGD